MEPWWQEIGHEIANEFSDLTNLADVTRVTLRLLVAATLSGMLGFEREQKGKSAGLRTHMLVGIGSAIFVLLPQQFGVPSDAITRVLQGVITGVGFLGAGSIIKGNASDGNIQGLTTAASIWLTAAIGVTAGMGRETTAILSTLLALAILTSFLKVERWMGADKNETSEILRG